MKATISAIWNPLTLINSWQNYGSGWATPAWAQTEDGIVICRGLIYAGTAAPVVVANLPVGVRPLEHRIFRSVSYSTVYVVTDLRVSNNGDIILQSGATAFLSLDPIIFPAEQ